MDIWTRVGLGLTFVFPLLQWQLKDMPHWVTAPGIAAGILFMLYGLVPDRESLPTSAVACVFLGSMLLVSGGVLAYENYRSNGKSPPLSQVITLPAQIDAQLTLDSFDQETARYHFTLINRENHEISVIRSRHKIKGRDGELYFAEIESQLTRQITANGGRISDNGLSYNGLPNDCTISYDVDYENNGRPFTIHFTFQTLPVPLLNLPIDPFQRSEKASPFDKLKMQASAEDALNSTIGGMELRFPEMKDDGSLNVYSIQGKDRRLSYDLSKMQVEMSMKTQFGLVTITGKLIKNETYIHTVAFSWDDNARSIRLEIDGVRSQKLYR